LAKILGQPCAFQVTSSGDTAARGISGAFGNANAVLLSDEATAAMAGGVIPTPLRIFCTGNHD
jgi:hypothetical protein